MKTKPRTSRKFMLLLWPEQNEKIERIRTLLIKAFPGRRVSDADAIRYAIDYMPIPKHINPISTTTSD